MERLLIAVNTTLLCSVVGVLGFLLPSCSELQDTLPPTGGSLNVHGEGWVDTSSSNFHGRYLATAQGNVQQCLTCHGDNFRGGTSGVSCVACHEAVGGTLHGRGWLDRSSSNFHGRAIRANNWVMTGCRECHGVQYDGGKVGVSCRTCHAVAAGPENCATCHGSPGSPAPPRDLQGNTSRTFPGVGAHQKHLLGSAISAGVICSDCHNVPPSVYTAGHVDSPQPAEVPMSGFLPHVVTNETTTVDWDPALRVFRPQPVYSATSLSCSNVYCHGHFKNGNDTLVVKWTDPDAQTGAACGTCHGDVTRPTPADRALPKTTARGGTHPNVTTCFACHYKVTQGDLIDANLNFVDKTKHINGRLNVFGAERDF